VSRVVGKAKPEFLMAARTRSLDSWTAVSGRPTMVKEGRPREMSTSTWMMAPSSPMTAQLKTLASMLPPLVALKECSRGQNARQARTVTIARQRLLERTSDDNLAQAPKLQEDSLRDA
jgi:hypothetical protein